MKLVEVGGSIYGDVNRKWYQAVAATFGQEAADELHHDVWFAPGGTGDHENTTISQLMGFADEDEVTTPMKVWQCLPAMEYANDPGIRAGRRKRMADAHSPVRRTRAG